MMKTWFLLLTLLLVSCNGNDSTDCSAAQAETAEGAACVVTDPGPGIDVGDGMGALPNEALTFETNLSFFNTDSSDEEKFQRAIDIIKRVIATEEFRSRVINHTYNGKKTYVDNGGYSNLKIYQMILEGAEKLQPAKNNTMDMEVELYYASTTTIGYTYPNTRRIWVNTKYFDSNTVEKVASNLMHEWLHKLGFTHATSYSVSRDYSVPYAVGRMISSIGATLD